MIRSCASCLVNLVSSTLEASKVGALAADVVDVAGPVRCVRLGPLVREVMELMLPLAHERVKLQTEVEIGTWALGMLSLPTQHVHAAQPLACGCLFATR